MSDSMRNRPGGEQDNNRTEENTGGQTRYDGFDGMNYEQIRQPYNPNNRDKKRGNASSSGGPNEVEKA